MLLGCMSTSKSTDYLRNKVCDQSIVVQDIILADLLYIIVAK